MRDGCASPPRYAAAMAGPTPVPLPDPPRDAVAALAAHRAALARCHACPRMQGPPVTGAAVLSRVYLVGQAPGVREGPLNRPFAHTAGRTLFRWLAQAGLDEAAVRERVAISAVCRCFPGRLAGGGDRAPSAAEANACQRWMAAEIALLRPDLIIPVGRLAIARLLPGLSLEEAVGRVHPCTWQGHTAMAVPLPHPSGASSWWKRPPGAGLLAAALQALAAHPAWRALGAEPAAPSDAPGSPTSALGRAPMAGVEASHQQAAGRRGAR